MLGWYAIPAAPLFVLYLFMGALPFRIAADLGWWPHDYNTDAGEALLGFQLGGFLALVVLALAIPLITAQTAKGMRLRVNGTAAALLVIALPLASWAVGLAAWFG
jgi:hypothetical protein